MIGKAKNERLRLKYEEAFYKPLRAALKKQISSFTSDLKNGGVQYALRQIDVDMWNKHVAPVIRTLQVQAGLAKANQVLSDLNRSRMSQKRTTFGYNREWTSQILQYFAVHLFEKIVIPISDTTREYIRTIISRGIEEGWSIETMLREIEREDYLDGRVRRILRTEANRAINHGAGLGESKYAYKTKQVWAAVDDFRTRPAHHAADGQQRELNEPFLVGGEYLEFPGDPTASGENTINCRCYREFVPVRDGDGKLIPKDNTQPVRIRGRLRRQLQDILTELRQ